MPPEYPKEINIVHKLRGVQVFPETRAQMLPSFPVTLSHVPVFF